MLLPTFVVALLLGIFARSSGHPAALVFLHIVLTIGVELIFGVSTGFDILALIKEPLFPS